MHSPAAPGVVRRVLAASDLGARARCLAGLGLRAHVRRAPPTPSWARWRAAGLLVPSSQGVGWEAVGAETPEGVRLPAEQRKGEAQGAPRAP